MTTDEDDLLQQLLTENETLDWIIQGLLKHVRHDGTPGRECSYDRGDEDWEPVPCRCGLATYVNAYKEVIGK